MKMRKGRILLLLLLCCFCLTSCHTHSTTATVVSQAEQYVADKYGDGFQVVESSYLTQYVQAWFPHESEDVCVVFSGNSNVFTVWYNTEDGVFYDNYQSDIIDEAIKTVILSDLYEAVSPCVPFEDECIFASVDDLNLSIKGSYYHTYFDGDILSFCNAEKPSLEMKDFNGIILFGEDSDREDWESRLGIIQDVCSTYFSVPRHFSHGSRQDYVIRANVICREAYKDGRIARYDAATEGFIACLTIEQDRAEIYVPNWIEVTDGVFLTAAAERPDIVLKEGDILLEEAYSIEEFQNILDEYPVSAGSAHEAVPITPAYRVVFSDALLERLDNPGLPVSIRADRDVTAMYQCILDERDKTSSLWLVLYVEMNDYTVLYDSASEVNRFFYWAYKQ